MFFKEKNSNLSEIMFDVYGLMQTLFVGVDALYDLAIGTTQYKYHLNINQNEVLRSLKYVRNDIVGHPTHRTYDDGSYGFSVIDEEHIGRDKLSYVTYVVLKHKTETVTHQIDLPNLITQYQTEKEKIIKDLNDYINQNKTTNLSVDFSYSMMQKSLLKLLTKDDVKKLEEQFILEQNLDDNSGHRVLWRLSLLKLLFEWKDLKYQDLIDYLIKQQAYKVYSMVSEIYNVKPDLKHIPVPKILVTFYKLLRKNPSLVPYLEYLNDPDSPLFVNNVDAIKRTVKQKSIVEFLDWFLNLNDKDKQYLVGQSLKLYRKK